MVFRFLAIDRLIVIALFSFILLGMAGSPPLVGGPAPIFELENMDGKVVKSSDLKGKTLVLNFWATWCVPCIKEMPALNKAYPLLKNKDVEIVAINFSESKEKVEKFISDYHLKFPVLLDSYGDISQDYRVGGLPVTYFITPDGIVAGKIFGGGLTQELIEEKLKQLSQPMQPQGEIVPAN